MTPEEFGRYWSTAYPRCPPVGYLLRQRYEPRWLRIHTLPGSQRYAETEGEAQEILRRHNTVLTDILGHGRSYVLVSMEYSEVPVPAPRRPVMPWSLGGTSGRHFLSIPMEEAPAPIYWHFFMDTRRWEPGMADPLLGEIANDAVRNVTVVSAERHIVYAPYDGGADIILPSESARDAMRRHYAPWLPTHPLGL